MSKTKELDETAQGVADFTLDEIAQGIADFTMELMYDNIDWQLSDFKQDGDDYNAIHSYVMNLAIAKMYEETTK